MKCLPITVLLLLTACSTTPKLNIPDNRREWFSCKTELYCTRTEGSLVKAAAKKAIEIYFGTDLGDDFCEKYYQNWGFDYRLPVEERCGSMAQPEQQE